MQTLAVRLYGPNDLRLETFELPEMAEDEILASIVSNSICMSSHKAAEQGEKHKRVPDDIADNPVIIGHEFCGTILEVGERWRDKFSAGQKYSVQPALSVVGKEHEAPGYSFQTIGGNATKILIPREVMEMDCLLTYEGDAFFKASLSEPVSCIAGAFNTHYHHKQGEYQHTMGIVEGGAMVILAGAGPMGLGAIDYAMHGPRRPRLIVVTDIDQNRIDRAASLFTPEDAKGDGVDLHYVNTSGDDPIGSVKALNNGQGYDDVMVFAPVPVLIEQASKLLGFNGCLNFFAGPTKPEFYASINFYDVHYNGHHIIGSSGGNTEDMREALALMGKGLINPASMITHVGGMDSVVQTIINLPSIPGGKKLIYTNISMPLTALEDFEELGSTDPLFRELAAITQRSNGLWSTEAETYLLANSKTMAG